MSEALNRGSIERLWRRFCGHLSLTNTVFAILACSILAGCFPSGPSSKQERIKQVEGIIAKAGGEVEILRESKELFSRCSGKTWAAPGRREDESLKGLSGIQSLGDVFYYEEAHIHIRVYNSHQDTYFIYLLNPEKPRPENFECIAGNVGFITQRDQSANQRQP